MSLIADALNPSPRASSGTSLPPWNDFWYAKDPSGFVFEAGAVALSPETILRCGTVLAALRFLGDSWAMCPPSTFIRTATSRQEDPTHYSQIVLRNPNRWQTHNRWRHLQAVRLKLWGNSYNEIRGGRRSWAEELWPLHPDHVRITDQRADGSLQYEYFNPQMPRRTLGQDRVLHFRDISTDGIAGLEIYRLIRNVVGIALKAEQHQATFLHKGARASALVIPSAPLKPEDRVALRDSIAEHFGSSWLGITPFGVDVKPLSINHREAQFAELSDQTVGALLRFLGVPGVVVGWMGDKTSTYASAKEFFESGGIKHTILPILTNAEAEEEKALLRPEDNRQIKHNLDALLRANWKDRIDGLVKATGGPIFSVDEARAIEDFDELGPPYDRPHIPSNMLGVDAEREPPEEPPPPPPRRPPPPDDDEDEEMRRLPAGPDAEAEVARLSEQLERERKRSLLLARDNASRVVRRETEGLMSRAPKLAKNRDKWRAFVLEFYGAHADYVAKTMRISDAAARGYCDGQASAVLGSGLAVVETWERDVPERLVMLAAGGGE